MNLLTTYNTAKEYVGDEPLFGLKHDLYKSQLIIDSPVVNKLRSINERLLGFFNKKDISSMAIIERNENLAKKIENQLTILILEVQQEDEYIEQFSHKVINQMWLDSVYDYFLKYFNNRVALGEIT